MQKQNAKNHENVVHGGGDHLYIYIYIYSFGQALASTAVDVGETTTNIPCGHFCMF